MNTQPPWLSALRWLVLATVACSILHYADNLLFFEHYPEPPWINRHIIDAFWWLMTPLAWSGYRLMRRGALRSGAATLLAYGACNLLTLGHYHYAPLHDISLRIHAFIVLEALLAAALIAFLLVTQTRRSTA